MEKITTRTAEFSFLEKDILRTKMKEDVEVDVNDIKNSIEVTIKITAGKKYCSLVDARVPISITKEARELSASQRYIKPYARAVLVNSLATKILANFMKQFDRSDFFCQVFTDEQKAMEWLRGKAKEIADLK